MILQNILTIWQKRHVIEFFTVCTKLVEMAILYSKDLTTTTNVTSSGARPDARDNYWFRSPMPKLFELNWHALFRGSLNFYSCTTWFLDLVRLNGVWLYKDLKVLDLQANVSLAQLVRHWTLKLVIISCIRSSCTGGNFFLLLLNLLNKIMPFQPTLYKLWKIRLKHIGK